MYSTWLYSSNMPSIKLYHFLIFLSLVSSGKRHISKIQEVSDHCPIVQFHQLTTSLLKAWTRSLVTRCTYLRHAPRLLPKRSWSFLQAQELPTKCLRRFTISSLTAWTSSLATHISAICTYWVQEMIAHCPERYLHEEILHQNVYISYKTKMPS